MMKIGVIQICSQLDPSENIKKIRHFLDEAKSLDLEAVFLPECFYSLSNGLEPTKFLVEKGNVHYEQIRDLARDYKIYLLGGSAATHNPNGQKVINRNYNFDPTGQELTHYDKIHLFSCELNGLKEKKSIDESIVYACGDTPQILEVGDFKIGLGICFDVRFPEMSRQYFKQGANLLSFSSAFTVPTGKAHWHTLLRARAIENQCYVVAAAQWGQNNERISTYGHSLIVDPWGQVLADATEGEKLIWAKIDLDVLNDVRSRLNVPVDL